MRSLLTGLRPEQMGAPINNDDQTIEKFTNKAQILLPHNRHRLNLHKLTNSFQSKPSSAPPTLLPSPIFHYGIPDGRNVKNEVEDSPSLSISPAPIPSPTPVSTSAPVQPKKWDFNLTAKEAGYVYNPRKRKIDIAYKFASPSSSEDSDESDDNDSDSSDLPNPKRRALTPPAVRSTSKESESDSSNTQSSKSRPITPIPAPAVRSTSKESESDSSNTQSSKSRTITPTPDPAPVRSKGWDFSLTAEEAGYVYNPLKSLMNLTNRFASPSDSEDFDESDDSESDFGSTPNHTPSSTTKLQIQSPAISTLTQWRYQHQVDPINPKTPPSIKTIRQMEQAYNAWRQAHPNGEMHPSFVPIPLPSVTPQVEQVEEMEPSPIQYCRQEQQQQQEFPRAPSYSPITIPSSSPQIQPPSASAEISSSFPANLPSPSVAVRLEPHSAVLDHLTAQYIAQGPHPQIADVNHAVVDQIVATQTLGRHLADRMPFVRAASRRLQAVIGVRNDLPFDLLMGSGEKDAENLVVGPDGKLVDLGLRNLGARSHTDGVEMAGRGGSGIREYLAAVRCNGATNGEAAGNNRENMGANTNAESPSTSAHNVQNIHTSLNNHPSPNTNSPAPSHQQYAAQQREARESHQTSTTPFFPPSVNPHTGQGLREYLLTRASITGSMKRECRSISFHDFTPDLRTGEFRNELLVHFGVDGISKSDRVECMELGLPDANGNLHPWLSIFIQRPLITLNTPSTGCPSTSTPPNFPTPAPTSWLCIAVPLANITSYPIQADTSLPSSLLEETLVKNQHGLPTKKIAKRQDYDFSFQGIPIFEFSTRSMFSATSISSNPDENEHAAPIADFMSVENLNPYEPTDPYHPFPHEVTQNPALLQSACREYAYKSGVRGEELRSFGALMEDASGVDISEELSPNEGVWWSEFYRGLTVDRIRWEKVRRSMGRGRCRVVVRWQDIPEELKVEGLGLRRRMGGVERVVEGMTREGLQGGKRRERKAGTDNSGLQQNVGLGVMDVNMNAGARSSAMRSGSGEAFRDSLREGDWKSDDFEWWVELSAWSWDESSGGR